MTANDNHATYTVRELAERWRCSRQQVMTAVHEGRLRAFRVGKREYRITAEEAVRFETAAKETA